MYQLKTGLLVLFLLFVSVISATVDIFHSTDKTYEISKENDGFSIEVREILKYRYLTDKGLNVRRFRNTISNTALNVKAHAYINDESSLKIMKYWRTEQSSSVFASDTKVYEFYVQKDVKISDVFKYILTYQYNSLNHLSAIPIENSESAESQVYTFKCGNGISVDFDIALIDSTISFEKKVDGKYTKLIVNHNDKSKNLDYYKLNGIGAYVAVQVSYNGEPQTVSSMDSFVNFYDSKFSLTPEDLGESVFLPSVNSSDSDYTKAQKIHEYVRDHIRYLAMHNDNHSLFPHKPSEVIKAGYGDCKDMAFLASALGAKYGIKIYPALVAIDERPQFDYPHMSSFDHVITVSEIDGKLIFSDPTANYYDFGQVPEYEYNKRSLILDKENPRFEKVIRDKKKPDADITIELNFDNFKQCNVSVVLDNSFSNSIRKDSQFMKNMDIENMVSNAITSNFRNISIDYFVKEREENGKLILSAKADMSKFVIESERNYFFPQMPFVYISNEILERDDNMDIHLGTIFDINMELKIKGGGKINGDKFSLPENNILKVASTVEKGEADEYSINYSIVQYKSKVEYLEKQAFLNSMKEFFNSKKKMFVMQKEI